MGRLEPGIGSSSNRDVGHFQNAPSTGERPFRHVQLPRKTSAWPLSADHQEEPRPSLPVVRREVRVRGRTEHLDARALLRLVASVDADNHHRSASKRPRRDDPEPGSILDDTLLNDLLPDLLPCSRTLECAAEQHLGEHPWGLLKAQKVHQLVTITMVSTPDLVSDHHDDTS